MTQKDLKRVTEYARSKSLPVGMFRDSFAGVPVEIVSNLNRPRCGYGGRPVIQVNHADFAYLRDVSDDEVREAMANG